MYIHSAETVKTKQLLLRAFEKRSIAWKYSL